MKKNHNKFLWSIALCVQFLIFGSAWGQVANYSFSSSSGTYTAISGGTLLASSTTTTTLDEEVYTANSIGFNFVYNGVTYNTFGLNSNGWISMGSTSPVTSYTPISTGTSSNIISPISGDLYGRQFITANTTSGNPTITMTTGSLLGVSVGDAVFGTGIATGSTVVSKTTTTVTLSVNASSTGTARNIRFANGKVIFETTGTAPNRVLVVQFSNFSRFATTGGSDYMNFQIRLYETSNVINFIYDIPYVNSSVTREVGLRGSANTDFNNRTSTTNWASTTSGSSNSSNVTFSSTVKPSSGLTFTWTPPSPCSGTPTPGNSVASVNPVGSGSSTVLSLQNVTSGSGVTYQWKSSTDNVTYTSISGATNATYTATPSAATYYVCDVTCSGVTTTSNPVQVTLTYCTPTSSSSSTYFSGFTTSGGATNISNNPTAFSSGGYVNYSSSMAVSQFATGTVNFSATIVGGTAGIAIFVDYNNDFDFTDVGETVYNSMAYQSNGTTNSSFIIPSGTPLGNYRMRIITDYNATSPTSCSFASGSRGEIEDYTLTVVAQPSCLAPSVSATNTIATTSATINWSASTSNPANGYEWEVRASGNGGTGATGLTASGTAAAGIITANATGLSAQTAYTVWVRSNCGSAFSIWVSGGAFTTPCNAITSLPWTEGFEGVTVGSTVVGASTSLPSCWNSQSTKWSSSDATTYNTAKTGTKYIRYAWSATDAFIWTPGFQLTAGVSYDFSFYAQGDGFIDWVNDVFVNTSVSSTGATQLTPSYSPTGAGSAAIQSYNLVSRTFVPTTSGIYYFAIRGNESTGAPWYMAFDDFKLEETPACLVPTAPTISAITNAGATLSWTAPSTVPGSGYEVYYSTTNTAPTAGTTATETVATGTSLAIAGLSANTSYYAWVRSKCGSGDVSTWVASASFTTLQIPATLPYSDDLSSNDYSFVNGSLTNKWVFGSAVGNTGSSIYVSNDNGISNAYSNSSSTVAHAFRDITIPSGSTLANFSFDWIANGESGYDYLRVWIVPVSFVPSAGSEITSGSGRIQVGVDFIEQTTWQTYTDATLNVSSFANSTMRLVFEWSNDDVFGDNPPGAIDNVNLSIPLCLAPSAPIVSSITNVGATLSWTAPSPAPGSGYEVYYSATNTAPTAGTTPTETVATGTSLAIAGLTANTTYYTWVRSKCGSGDVSAWIASASFTTPCDPITSLPWTEGFEGVTVGNTVVGSSTSLPSCWNSQSTKWSSTDETTYNTSQTGTKYIRYAWSSTDAFIWTPGFQLTAGVSYDFSFYAQGDGFTSWVNDVFVNSSVSAVGTTQLTPAYSPTGAGSAAIQSYNLVSRTFVPTTSGIYYFAIRGNQSSSAPWYMAFDDFSLELTPSPLPTELVSFAANCEDNNTVAVNWTTASEHNSDYFIVEKSRNGSTWNELKKIAAAGNSSQLINYSVADASDINGTVYYRLSQYDIDGASKVYDIISTNCSAENELAMVAYPNPSNGQFTVKIENALGGKYDLTITDMQGKAIEQQNIQLETGTTVVKLNPIGLKPGVYLLQLVNAGTIEKQLKLVVN
jgi:hypothetical protein